MLFLILTPTRWKLKKAIQVLNLTFNELKLEQHRGKTLIGRIERGFGFLGYFIKPDILSVFLKTTINFLEHIGRLHEQGQSTISAIYPEFAEVIRQ